MTYEKVARVGKIKKGNGLYEKVVKFNINHSRILHFVDNITHLMRVPTSDVCCKLTIESLFV